MMQPRIPLGVDHFKTATSGTSFPAGSAHGYRSDDANVSQRQCPGRLGLPVGCLFGRYGSGSWESQEGFVQGEVPLRGDLPIEALQADRSLLTQLSLEPWACHQLRQGGTAFIDVTGGEI